MSKNAYPHQKFKIYRPIEIQILANLTEDEINYYLYEIKKIIDRYQSHLDHEEKSNTVPIKSNVLFNNKRKIFRELEESLSEQGKTPQARLARFIEVYNKHHNQEHTPTLRIRRRKNAISAKFWELVDWVLEKMGRSPSVLGIESAATTKKIHRTLLKITKKSPSPKQHEAEAQKREAEAQKQREAEAQKREAEAQKQREAEAQKREAEAQKQREAEAQKREAEAQKQREAEAQKREAEAQKQREAEAQKREAEAQKQREAEAQKQREAEAQKREAEAQKREAEAQKQREAEAQKREAEAQRQREAEAQKQREAEAQRQREAEAQKQREAEAQKQREAEAQKREAEAQKQREAEAQKREAEAQKQREAEAQKREAEAQKQREAEAQKREAEAQKQREAEAQKREAEAQRQREAEAQKQREAEAQRQREAEAQKQREAEAQKQREAEAQKREAEAQKQREAEAQKREAEAQKQREAEAQKREAEAQKQREAEAQKREAEAQKQREAEAQKREAEAQRQREAEAQIPKIIVLSTQDLEMNPPCKNSDEQEKYRCLTAQEIANLRAARKIQYHPLRDNTGHSGAAIAEVTGSIFSVVRSEKNRNKFLSSHSAIKNYVSNNGWAIITGHGNAGIDHTAGHYIPDPKTTAQVGLSRNLTGPDRAQRSPEDFVNTMLEAGLESGNHLNILLCVCYGAEPGLNNQKSFAENLALAFANHGISTTIIASHHPVKRFNANHIKNGEIIFDESIGIAPKDICVLNTKAATSGSAITTTEDFPNDTFIISTKGFQFKNKHNNSIFNSNALTAQAVSAGVKPLTNAPTNTTLFPSAQQVNVTQAVGNSKLDFGLGYIPPTMSGEDACQLLIGREPGSYFVRYSERQHAYAVSFRDTVNVKHLIGIDIKPPLKAGGEHPVATRNSNNEIENYPSMLAYLTKLTTDNVIKKDILASTTGQKSEPRRNAQ